MLYCEVGGGCQRGEEGRPVPGRQADAGQILYGLTCVQNLKLSHSQQRERVSVKAGGGEQVMPRERQQPQAPAARTGPGAGVEPGACSCRRRVPPHLAEMVDLG